MTPPYAQANGDGYIVSTTNEGALVGLWGGKAKRISESAEVEIKKRRDKGIPVHLDEIEAQVHALGN
jgi:hypothetical protein